MQALQEGGVVTDLLTKLAPAERYTFNFEGNSQALDHVYVSPALFSGSDVDILHVNSGLIPSSVASDHDPIVALVRLFIHATSSIAMATYAKSFLVC